MEAYLQARGVVRRFGQLEVLKGVDLDIAKGEVVSIVGASGAGKSTLLHILGSLDQPDEGSVSIGGKTITDLKPKALAKLRNADIGFVFQFHNLLPEFTALENAALPGYLAGKSKAVAHHEARQLLERLNLGHRLDHQPSQLSGGEQQRVAVARALVNGPGLVLADEPSGNLDSEHAQQLHELFFQLRQELDFTFVIVTHNVGLADMADRKLVMRDGVFVANLSAAL